MIPQGVYLVVQSTVSPGLGKTLLYASLIVELLASFSIYYHRRFVRDPDTPSGRYSLLCVLPVIAAAALLSFTGLGFANDPAVILDAPFWSADNYPDPDFLRALVHGHPAGRLDGRRGCCTDCVMTSRPSACTPASSSSPRC